MPKAQKLEASGAAASPVLHAMQALEAPQKSLVQQLYALAILNREDAMRRLHSSALPHDVSIAQQPPSLLALARPPDSAVPTFRAPPNSPPRTPVYRIRPRPSRRFGAVSSGTTRGNDAALAIHAARERAFPTFHDGYGVPTRRSDHTSRQQSPGTMLAGNLGGAGDSLSDSYLLQPQAPQRAELQPLPPRTPLRPDDLLRSYPTRETTVPPPAPYNSKRNGSSSKPQLEPLPRSTVRALLEVPLARGSSSEPRAARAMGDGASLVPPPRHSQSASSPRFDAWAAAEEDLARQAMGEQVGGEMQTLKMAAAIGGGVLGAF